MLLALAGLVVLAVVGRCLFTTPPAAPPTDGTATVETPSPSATDGGPGTTASTGGAATPSAPKPRAQFPT